MSRRFTLGGADGVGREYVVEGDTIHHRLTQSNRQAILEKNNEMRKNKDALKTTQWGRLAMDIPVSDLPMLDKFFPGIASAAHPDHQWQMRRLLESPAGIPYRLQDHKRRGGIK